MKILSKLKRCFFKIKLKLMNIEFNFGSDCVKKSYFRNG